jgi:effector-binding domain-containing protein
MKALLKILYFFLILFLLFLLIGIFFPKTAYIESSIQINASPEIVFDQVNNLKNWKNWEPWQLPDSTIKFNEPLSGAGASISWTNQNTNQGKISILESNPTSKISVEMDFGKQGKVLSNWEFKNEVGTTKVIWGISNSNLKYFERYFALFFKKNMTITLNSGLKKLKETSEEMRLDRVSEVKEVDLLPGHSVIITDSATMQDMNKKMTGIYDKLKSYLEKRNLQLEGFPFAIFYDWGGDGSNKFACGIPITEKTWNWNEFQYLEIPSGHAIMVTHWGKFGSIKPYNILDEYLKEKQLEITGYPWEVYTTDQASEPDTSKWQTNVYYMVKMKD